jgi:serine/threonine-protein kinase
MPREVTLLENTYVGPFLILNKLGNTQRHRVFHARQTQQNRDVAIKFLSVPTGVARSKALDKIEREADALQQLSHPNLVRVFGAGADDDRIFFATELVEGESLTSLLARRGRISTDLAIEFGTQIAELLTYLNQKDLVHSKLTPDKILIGPENQVKVTDLRLNRARRRRWDAIRKRELDIAAYMAPEQFTEGATAKSDLYSLGVILFEMLTGKLRIPSARSSE